MEIFFLRVGEKKKVMSDKNGVAELSPEVSALIDEAISKYSFKLAPIRITVATSTKEKHAVDAKEDEEARPSTGAKKRRL